MALPPDSERTAATTELLLETHFQDIEMLRYACAMEPAALDVHMYSLDQELDAEAAFALEGLADHLTLFVLCVLCCQVRAAQWRAPPRGDPAESLETDPQ